MKRFLSRVFTKLHAHAPGVDAEFRNVYQALSNLDMGDFKWAFRPLDPSTSPPAPRKLYLLVLDREPGNLTYKTVLTIDDTGLIVAAGSPSYSTDPGRY